MKLDLVGQFFAAGSSDNKFSIFGIAPRFGITESKTFLSKLLNPIMYHWMKILRVDKYLERNRK